MADKKEPVVLGYGLVDKEIKDLVKAEGRIVRVLKADAPQNATLLYDNGVESDNLSEVIVAFPYLFQLLEEVDNLPKGTFLYGDVDKASGNGDFYLYDKDGQPRFIEEGYVYQRGVEEFKEIFGYGLVLPVRVTEAKATSPVTKIIEYVDEMEIHCEFDNGVIKVLDDSEVLLLTRREKLSQDTENIPANTIVYGVDEGPRKDGKVEVFLADGTPHLVHVNFLENVGLEKQFR